MQIEHEPPRSPRSHHIYFGSNAHSISFPISLAVIMVEPIGVSLAVVGLAVQAADTMLRIRRMFVGIKEAPKLIRRIHQELFDMESVFRDISLAGKHFPDASEAGFERLMESYFEHVDPIADMLIRVQVKREDSSARRAWKAFVTNDNRPVFEELLRNLERTKTNIITYLAGLNIQIAGYNHPLYLLLHG